MPYASVIYSKSDRPYTFFTSNTEMSKGEKVLVKDKNGFSVCSFLTYVKKPSFPCNIIVLSEADLDEIAEEILYEKETEEEEENGDNDDELA